MSEVTNAISEHALADYDRLREECGWVPLPGLALLELSGEDRKGWLQGQVTNNVRRLESGNSSAFCFSAATGHLLAVVDAWALPDRIAMTTAHECAPAVLHRCEQMVIMEDVTGHSVMEAKALYSIQGPTASEKLGQFVELPKLDAGIGAIDGVEVYLLRSNRTGLGGWDVWVPADATVLRARLESTFPQISAEAYNIARLEAGVPLFGADMNERTLPPELGPAFEARHISYNKGCYVGQEVLMRIHSRGHVNRQWMGIAADGPLELGATISHPSRKDAGVVTSAVFSPDFGHIGAAMLRAEAAYDGEMVRVITQRGEVEAEVRRMPFLRLE